MNNTQVIRLLEIIFNSLIVESYEEEVDFRIDARRNKKIT